MWARAGKHKLGATVRDQAKGRRWVNTKIPWTSFKSLSRYSNQNLDVLSPIEKTLLQRLVFSINLKLHNSDCFQNPFFGVLLFKTFWIVVILGRLYLCFCLFCLQPYAALHDCNKMIKPNGLFCYVYFRNGALIRIYIIRKIERHMFIALN